MITRRQGHVGAMPEPAALAAHISANKRLYRFAAELAREQSWSFGEGRWLRAMIDQVPDYLYIKDRNARFIIANKAIANELGNGNPNELIGKSDLDLHPIELARQYYEDDLGVIHGERELIDHEEVVIRPDGSTAWLSTTKLPLRSPDGSIVGLVCIARNVTERHIAERRMEFLAFHDSLTGLANRARFERDLADLVERAAGGTLATLVLIDLDRFKHVNDTLGHMAGDDLLRQVGNRVFQLVGPAGKLARLGGDEFAILLEGRMAQTGESLCAAIQKQLGRPFRLIDEAAEVTASFGLTTCTPGVTAHGMLRQADIALYEAKARGRGRWEVFRPAMADAVEEKRRIEQDLRQALRSGDQLRLEYQPVFSARTGQMLGAEALVRWQHPVRGRLQPDVFIALAEERGLIEQLGEWVLSETCNMLARTTIPWVAVNVSPVELRSRYFVDHVLNDLESRGIDPQRLQLEITEGVLLDSSETTENSLSRLRAAGIRLALDDFGTGYSSLNYLRRYNVDKLKIDRSFVSQIGRSTDAEVIVRTIIDLGRSLDMQVTAEGVATEQQFDYLVALGCHELQGYLLSKPLALPDLLKFTASARLN